MQLCGKAQALPANRALSRASMPVPSQPMEAASSASSLPPKAPAAAAGAPPLILEAVNPEESLKGASSLKAGATNSNNISAKGITMHAGSDLRDNHSAAEASTGLRSSPTGSGGPVSGVAGPAGATPVHAVAEGREQASDIRGRGLGLAASRVAGSCGTAIMGAASNAEQ